MWGEEERLRRLRIVLFGNTRDRQGTLLSTTVGFHLSAAGGNQLLKQVLVVKTHGVRMVVVGHPHTTHQAVAWHIETLD